MKTLMTALAFVGGLTLAAGAASAANPSYCDMQARQYANQYANPGGSVLGGAALGAGLGAIISGATGGNVGTGAAIGAGVGAIGGGATQGGRWQQLYNNAYYQCMNQPGPKPYQPKPVYGGGGGGGAYQAWTPAWYQYCAARYKSFNPQTGYFLSYGGQYVFCK